MCPHTINDASVNPACAAYESINRTFLLEVLGGAEDSGGAPLQLATPPPRRVMMKPRRPMRMEINVRARPAWRSEVMVMDVACLLHCIWPVA